MRKSLAFLTKAAIICSVSLFALTAMTGAVAAVQLTWTQHTIPAYTGGGASGNVDVFGLLYTNDGVGNPCSSGCLWANARYEGSGTNDPQYSRSYLTTDIMSSPPASWMACDQSPYPAHIAGRFGLDRSSSTAATAYIPNGQVLGANGGVSDMSYISSVCVSNNNLNSTTTHDAVAFLKTSSQNAYYIKDNSSAGYSDSIMVTNDAASVTPPPTWTEETLSAPAGTKIYGIDGDDLAQKVYLATSDGLYACTGANYPVCDDSMAAWSKVTSQPMGSPALNNVLYKNNYLRGTTALTTGTQLLVVGSGNGAYIGKFNSMGNIVWSSAIVPKIGANTPVSAPIISGIAADQNYVYISSYAPPSSLGLTKAEVLKKYSPRNLMLSSCNNRSKLLQGLTIGGVTVFTTQWNGVSANMNQLLNYDSSNFYSAAVLGVSLQLNPTTNYATRVFVPSLKTINGNIVCNQGGYSVGQFSGYSYTAPTYVSTTIQCYPSGNFVAPGSVANCNSGDIGTVFYVYGGSPTGTGTHGLIAAFTDQAYTLQWSSAASLTNASGSAIGDGRGNTDLIVTALNTGAPAAKVCTDITISGYSDWFLPSGNNLGELNEMWTYRALIGGFSYPAYWSSTEQNAPNAWYQTFGSPTTSVGTALKTSSADVRCIRAF